MSDEAYTNLDLDTAEEMVIAAGKPELAKALRFQAQGVRNLVQGEWGGAFVKTLENIMDTRVISVLTTVQQQLDQQIDLAQQILGMVKTADKTAKEALTVAKAGAARLGKFQQDLDGLHAGQKRISGEVKELRDKIEAGEQRLDRKREELDGIQQRLNDLDAFKADVEARIARSLSEDEVREFTVLLRQIAAERGGDGQ